VASVDVLDHTRRAVGSIELSTEIFGAPINGPVMHEVVLMQQAGQRQGTASTKTRGVVSGTGKKPYKQKHTGRARAGSNRSPLWRHGGIIFGPLPRGYGYSLPKKKVRAAIHSALSIKAKDNNLVVLDELPESDGKTKSLARMLEMLGLTSKTLMVISAEHDSLRRAAQNLHGVTVIDPKNLNVRDLLLHEKLLITRRELTRLEELWA
jgi:large subunit ribosomal protein L4